MGYPMGYPTFSFHPNSWLNQRQYVKSAWSLLLSSKIFPRCYFCCHATIFKNKLLPRRIIFTKEGKLQTPINYIIRWSYDYDYSTTILVSSHIPPSLAPAACYNGVKTEVKICLLLYYSLEDERRQQSGVWWPNKIK